MIPYSLWLWFTWRYSALKCGVRSNWKVAKWLKFGKSLNYFCVDERVSNVSLVIMHSKNMNINMDSNKSVAQANKKQTNKQTCMGIYKEDSNHLQNVHHINHNKDINKWSGRGWICMDFHAYCHRDLWFNQCSFISMTQVPAPGTASSCCWWADQLRTKDITPHKRTCSLWTLHDHWC